MFLRALVIEQWFQITEPPVLAFGVAGKQRCLLSSRDGRSITDTSTTKVAQTKMPAETTPLVVQKCLRRKRLHEEAEFKSSKPQNYSGVST